MTVLPTSTKTPTPKPTKTPTPKPTEESFQEEVLGIQYQEVSPTPSEEPEIISEKPKVNILAFVFIVFGILFVGFSVFAFLKQKGLNNDSGKNQEII